MGYYKTGEVTAEELTEDNIANLYENGYVATRKAKNYCIQTRSLRIRLAHFSLNSENRRILRKTEGLSCSLYPLPYESYSWEIHKLGKDYYSRKFGEHTMSATKIKSMFTDPDSENMSHVFVYKYNETVVGYCLTLKTDSIMHYAYPFYDLDFEIPNLGMAMMIQAIMYAQARNLTYVYLGSVVEPASKYKLQFEGLEWWDNEETRWNKDIQSLKDILDNASIAE